MNSDNIQTDFYSLASFPQTRARMVSMCNWSIVIYCCRFNRSEKSSLFYSVHFATCVLCRRESFRIEAKDEVKIKIQKLNIMRNGIIPFVGFHYDRFEVKSMRFWHHLYLFFCTLYLVLYPVSILGVVKEKSRTVKVQTNGTILFSFLFPWFYLYLFPEYFKMKVQRKLI